MAPKKDGPPVDVATFQRPAFDPVPQNSRAFSFVVVEGPDRDLTFLVDGSERVLVGQSESCALRLSDREVSRRHAAIEPAGQRLRLTDLGSTNGTWVDGVSLVDGYLRGGEIVRVGSTAIGIDVHEQASVPALPALMGFGDVTGASAEMRRLYLLCERLAASTVPVIIEGETGTGKEVLAESIHEKSARAAGPFVVFDCTSVPPSLLESELFGHERGAFTGAVSTRIGVFEQAHGGTLLIDEIGDLDLHLQPKLLRALERSEVRRVGGDRFIKVDVRILAATRRDLDHEVQVGRFRDDLFHRLAVGRIELPPLRKRQGDIELLAQRFCKELGGGARSIPPELILRWQDYAWPGNVRELRNMVARTLALGELANLDREAPEEKAEKNDGATGAAGATDDLVERILAMRMPLSEAKHRLLEEFEHRYIERVLDQHAGNVTHAAAAASVGRRYFQRLRARRG